MQHLYVLRRRKVVVFLALTWVASLIGGFAPLTVLAFIVRTEDCSTWLLSTWLLGLISAVVRHGVNVDAAFLALIHIFIVVFLRCFRTRTLDLSSDMCPGVKALGHMRGDKVYVSPGRRVYLVRAVASHCVRV